MARDWRGRGPAWELEWGGRTWSLDPSGARPGLWVRGAGAGASGIGPLLGLDGLAAAGHNDPGAFPGEGPPGLTVRDGAVEATYQPRGWPGLTVRAAWRPVGADAVDLEVEAVLADAPGALGEVRGFEVTVASVLPEPAGSKTRQWVEPRDAAAAALSYDGREGDARDLTTLPPADAGRLAPRVIPSPWDDGLSGSCTRIGGWPFPAVCRCGLLGRSPSPTRSHLMDFPILDLMDQAACYHELLDLLHPGGLTCPRCGGGRDRYTAHRRRDGSPVVDYRCRDCRRVFNLFTGTPWQGTHRAPAQILLILRGFAQGAPTAALARELGASRPHLLALRHAVQARAAAAAPRAALPDDHVEADELYQNAGEKRGPAPGPGRPAAAARQ
jgi:transposase-like protein